MGSGNSMQRFSSQAREFTAASSDDELNDIGPQVSANAASPCSRCRAAHTHLKKCKPKRHEAIGLVTAQFSQ